MRYIGPAGYATEVLSTEDIAKGQEEEKVNIIEFCAEVAKVQTTVDGVRVVLDLGEPGVKVMAALTECKQNGVVLDVKAAPRPN